MSDAYAHCEAAVRASDRDRFVASLFAPADCRPHLFALYAFNLEIARVAEVAHTPLAGEIRMQWWYDALTGASHGEVTGHPVASALLDTLDRCRLSAQPLLDLIEARRSDLYEQPFATLADFDRYVRATSSGLIATAARILGPNGHDIAAAVDAAGLAYGTAALLGAAPLHASRGHVYVPTELLARHGAAGMDLLAGQATASVSAVLDELTSRAAGHFDAFLGVAKDLPVAPRPALLPVAIIPLILRRLRKHRHGTLSVAEITPLRRLLTILHAGWFGFPAP
jgi:15-cis-phytoene synthase